MGWLKPSFFVLSLFVVLGPTHCRVGDDSKVGVVRRYEECVLSRLSRSRFFKEQDRNHLLKAVEESLRDSDTKPGTVLRSFTTSATRLVAGTNTPLQDAYVTVTETCSLSLPQHLAEEVMREVQKILSEEPDGKKTLSRRREMPSTPPDLKIRRKRSPQAATFGSFWQPSESLQTVLSNILLNSNPFQNVFSSRTSRRDAIIYARSMVESGLSGYHFSVVQEAVSSVVNAISNFPFQPEANDYAIAVANGIASVLDARELSYFADGAGIGNAMVSRLQVMLNNNRNPTGFQSGFGGASSYSWSSSGNQQQQRQVNFQMNPGLVPNLPMNPGAVMNPGFMLNPGPVQIPQMNPPSPTFFDVPQTNPSEEFQGDMAFYLYQSDKILSAFCNGPFPGAYEMVKEGLSEYGMPVSETAASSATASLSSMNPSQVCAEFGNVIAESVTNALRDNDLLQSADAQKIADAMASSIAQAPPPSGPQEETPMFYDSPPSEPNPPILEYGMPPYVPIMDETQSQGAPETLEPPPLSSDSAPQEAKSQVEYPLLDPSFAPADYAVDTSTLTETDVPTGQESSSDDSRSRGQQPDDVPTGQEPSSDVSRTEGQRSDDVPTGQEPSSDDSRTRSQRPDDVPTGQEPSSDDSRTRGQRTDDVPTGQESSSDGSRARSQRTDDVPTGQQSFSDSSRDQQPEENPDQPQSRLDGQQEAPSQDKMTTTESKAPEIMSSTPADIITTTTTPYPDTATTPTPGKVMGTILKDIFTALRSLNRTSGDKADIGLNRDGVVTTLSPLTAPELERADSSVARLNSPDSSSDSAPPEAPVELQPSFMSTPPPRNPTTPEDEDDSDLRDPTLVFAHHVSDIASAAISLIRSRSVSILELCEKLNPLASVVDIAPLDVCGEVALVDFLLNVLKAVTLILRGV